jgi:transposase InsO family protein
VEQEILAWREQTGYGPLRLSVILERPASTIGKALRRLGRSRLPRAAGDPRVRCERAYAGELLHVDTKKLGRFWRVGKRIQGIPVERVLSDNAKAFHSHHRREVCAELGIACRYTRPYSPWTNGKAEAFVKTLLNEWPTASSTPPANTAAAPPQASSAGTSDADHTAHSPAGDRSAESHTCVVITASRLSLPSGSE